MRRTNTYTIDFVVRDDSTRRYVSDLEGKIADIGRAARNSIKSEDFAGGLQDAQKAADSLIKALSDGAKDSSVDFADVLKSYQSNSRRAIEALTRQYDALEAKKRDVESGRREIETLRAERARTADAQKRAQIDARIAQVQDRIRGASVDTLNAQIAQNRKIRANLKQAEIEATYRQKASKAEEAMAKWRDLQQKRKKATNDADRRALDDQIKRQKLYIQSIIEAKKALGQCTKEIEKEINKTTILQRAQKAVETVSNSRAARAARTVAKGVGGAMKGVAGAAGLAMGLASGVGDAAQKAVDLESAINRVHGIGGDDDKKHEVIKNLYYTTGADYSQIVEAINRVRNAMGAGASDDDVISGAEIEIKFPGMSQAFASTNTSYSIQSAQVFMARQKAIQRATGASGEQLKSASEIVANLRPQNFNSATGTDLQTIYLGLQNSGAFDTQEELDQAFRRFMRDQQGSGKNIFEFAKEYTDSGKWVDRIYNQRNKLQAANTIQSLDWQSMRNASETNSLKNTEKSSAEKALENSRKLEDSKNELLMKLIPVLQPIVDELANLVASNGVQDILKGLAMILSYVPKLLIPVFEALNIAIQWIATYIKPVILDFLAKAINFFGGDAKKITEMIEEQNKKNSLGIKALNVLPQESAGGLAMMPSIVGERGAEAVIPLDYSRKRRSENIVNNITQSFHMSGTETTALSLANAVKSRSFTRAVEDAGYIKRRSL